MTVEQETSAYLGARCEDVARDRHGLGGASDSSSSACTKAPLIGVDGKPLSVWQIWLWRLCVVMIVWAVLEIIFGVGFWIAGYLFSDVQVAGLTLGAIAISVSVTALVSAALNLIIGLLGLRGARNPDKITLFFWITLADAVLTSWAMASNISSGIFDVTGIVSGLFIIALAVCTWQVRGQTGYFDEHP